MYYKHEPYPYDGDGTKQTQNNPKPQKKVNWIKLITDLFKIAIGFLSGLYIN